MSNITIDASGALTSISTDASVFVVPVVGSISMDASATLVTLQQLSVTMNYNDKYEIDLSGDDAVALRDSFALSGEGASFAASLSNGAALTAVLKKVIDQAIKAGGGGKTLAEELSGDMKDRFQEYFNNVLSNILENVSLTSNVHSQDGAESLVNLLTPDACEIIAQQIPKTHYMAWSDASDESFTGSGLPLLDGDTLVFIFQTENTLTVNRVEEKTAGSNADSKPASADGAADAVANSDAAGANGVGSKYTTSLPGTASYIYESRRIAFFVTVTDVSPAA